jgi:hypothetical protein
VALARCCVLALFFVATSAGPAPRAQVVPYRHTDFPPGRIQSGLVGERGVLHKVPAGGPISRVNKSGTPPNSVAIAWREK